MKNILLFAAIAGLVLASCSKKNSGTEDTSGPYSIGSYYQEKGVAGVVYKVSADGMHGMIVSLGKTDYTWAYETPSTYSTGATHTANGVANMNKIKAISGWESKYPIFKWCDDLNKDGITGWYIPAKDELAQLYAGFCGLSAYPGKEANAATKYATARTKFNAVLEQHGGVAIDAYIISTFWSSSENNTNTAWALNFTDGWLFSNAKSCGDVVYAVRAF